MVNDDIQFETIHTEFRPKILGYLKRLVGEHEAEDLTQEVFIRVSRGLNAFRGDSRLSTWIYRIATNAALDRLRTRSFQDKDKTSSLDDESIEKAISIEFIGYKKGSFRIDNALVRKEMNACIRGIVMNLPVDHRTVLILSEFEGLTNREIASILQTSLETVKIRLHRARTKLKKELETHCSFYRNDENELACDPKTALTNYKNSP